LFSRVDEPASTTSTNAKLLGESRTISDAIDHHVDLILGLAEVNRDAIEKAKLRVIVDAVHGAGGPIARMLLTQLGCDFTILFEETSGQFPRTPEPLAEHLGRLAEEVKKQGADIGLAFDPDVDRLSLVDETGTAIGEEYTLALAADHVLTLKPGPVVTNLSTSGRIEAVAERHGQVVTRTPVGEANVVQGILETRARIGGEGNGGVILPALHLGRDAPGGAALILSALAERGTSLSRWVSTLPSLEMVKIKVDLSRDPVWEDLEKSLSSVLPGARIDRRDGIRISSGEDWVHLRKSGTEPVIRIIAEAASRSRATELVETARNALG
jgi:phosphomannomutase